MKKSTLSESQIIRAIKVNESFKIHCSDINRKYGYSETADYYL